MIHYTWNSITDLWVYFLTLPSRTKALTQKAGTPLAVSTAIAMSDSLGMLDTYVLENWTIE